jgi:hypothetical protein
MVAVALVVATVQAGADPAAADDVTAEQVSSGVVGPVGLAAVILGVGGLVVGLLRRHRRIALARAALLDPRPAPVPADHTETAA